MINNYNQHNYGILSENLETQVGLNEVLVKNIEACQELKNLISSSYGPYGESKMINQKNGKILITSDSSVILNNLEFIHPASKIIISSVFFQDQELGDSSGFLVIFAGEILLRSLKLLNKGFHSFEIIKTFQKAEIICLKIFHTLSNYRLKNLGSVKSLISILLVSVGFKCQNLAKHIIPQIAYACININSCKNHKFSQENIRVIKILGGGWFNTKTITGTIILKDSEGSIKVINSAKIAIFTCPFDFLTPETKSNMQFKNPTEMLSYESKEKDLMDEKINKFLAKGINVILAPHFNDGVIEICDKKKILVLKIQSKFEIQRIARLTNSTVLPNLISPKSHEIGFCDKVSVRTFGSQKVIIFHQEFSQNNIFSVIARANCNAILDSIERLVYKTSSIFKTIIRENKFIPGGGACEIEISRRLKSFSEGLLSPTERYIFNEFANCFEILPEILIENSKSKGSKLISLLHEKHKKGVESEGIDFVNFSTSCSKKSGTWDIFSSKFWAIKNSLDSVLTILSIDQIIIAKENLRN